MTPCEGNIGLSILNVKVFVWLNEIMWKSIKRTLTPFIKVRILIPQPNNINNLDNKSQILIYLHGHFIPLLSRYLIFT